MKGKVFLGIIFILIGVSSLFQQLGLWNFSEIISTWWPLILITIGGWQLSTNPISKTSGIILLLIGSLFQLRELNIITVSMAKFFWPIVIIAIGVSILLPKNKTNKNSKFNKKEFNEDIIDNFTIFSSIDAVNSSKNFKGGSLVAIFGGINLDLRNAIISHEGARIDVTAAFGGVDIKVPADWKVVVTGVPLFGVWSNKTNNKDYPAASSSPVLTIHCFAAFGGMDVIN